MLIGDVSDDEEFMQDSRDIDEPNLSNYCLMQPPLGITVSFLVLFVKLRFVLIFFLVY